jgi:RHS repeat-associated protein
VTLVWSPTTAEAGSTFSVYRSATTPVPLDGDHRIVTGLSSGSYPDLDGQLGDYYVVTAVNEYGESGPSNTAQAQKVGITGGEEAGSMVAGGTEVLSGEEVILKYYFLGGRRVAMREDGEVYYFHTDHLGSTSAMSDGAGNAYGDPVRYLPFGEVRSGDLEALPTDHGFTGHKHEAAELGLIFMEARFYAPGLGRFLSADILVPNPADPQSYNRFAYINNNPIGFWDPDGHDPLDSQWQSDFSNAHNRPPEWYDRLIRLFSIVFPEEWDWTQFYNPDGTLQSYEALETILRNPAVGRDWDGLPNALAEMAAWYESDETEAFVRDIGTLFSGLADRFDASMNFAVTGCQEGLSCDDRAALPSHIWAYLGPDGMSSDLTGQSDPDANVHHWAWALVLGYHQGFLAVAINTYREFDQAGGAIAAYRNVDSRADIWLGNRAAMMGVDIRNFGASPDMIRLLWWLNIGE